MPYANITLTCSCCGNKFNHRHNCLKSSDVESYVEWAKENITECPECRAKEKRSKEAIEMRNNSVVIRVLYKDYKNELSIAQSVPESYDEKTKTIEISIQKRCFRDIELYAKTDDELINILICGRGFSREEAAGRIPQWRESVETSMNKAIGSGWKKLIYDYRDQFPKEEINNSKKESEDEETCTCNKEESVVEEETTDTKEESAYDTVEKETVTESSTEENAESNDGITVIERIKKATENMNCETDSIDKLIALAYLIGREDATREISDKYNEILSDQRKRADESRYHNFANEIIGYKQYIYSGDYAQGMKESFGSDKTKL